jgi:hypothetical protein
MTPQAMGGLAVANLVPPSSCPRCLASFNGRSWYSWLAHKGLHSLADRYFCGNLSKAAERLARNGLARQDPAPWNGAFKHKPIKPYISKEPTVKTDFSQIQFNEEEHRYFLDGKELTSVTAKIKEFQTPFDRDRIAQRTAEKQGRTVAEILAEWEAKGEKGRKLGKIVHAHIEETLSRNGNKQAGQLALDPFLSLNLKLPEIEAFDNLWRQTVPTVSWCQEHVEWIIGDAELGIAGTVDTVLFSHQTKKYHIWDWKTGKFDLNNKWQNLLEPFDYLDASKFNIYSLQVSLYRLIIERNTGLELGDSYLVHLSHPTMGYEVHRAIDLRERLLAWLEIPF